MGSRANEPETAAAASDPARPGEPSASAQPPVRLAAGSGTPASPLDDDGDPPTTFGRYRLESVLGAGGMGVVHRAWDPQLERPVAIKVVQRAAHDGSRMRLVREAQSLARLSHDNICRVYDVGTEGDEVWVVMELIDGSSLRDWATAHPATEDILRVLLDAAEGLAAAHAAGVIHRDVKPENVLVTHAGRAIVTDFGLARVDLPLDPVASTVALDLHRTATGAIAGTPAYMSPEQLTGGDLDARVDQFAWAVMAWELLTGMRPFPIHPSARLEAIRAGVAPPAALPRELGTALVRALSMLPRDRFPSMRVLIDSIRSAAITPRDEHRRQLFTTIVSGASVLAAIAATVTVWTLTRTDAPDTRTPELSASRTVATPDTRTPDTRTPDTRTPDTRTPDTRTPDTATTVAIAPPAPTPPSPSPSTTEPAQPIKPTRPPRPTRTTVAKASAAPPPRTPPAPIESTATDDQPPADLQAATSPPAGDETPRLPPYKRANALGMLETFCRIPIDAAKPDPALGRPIVDWGKVVRREVVKGKLGPHEQTLLLYEVKGHRGTYRFRGEQWATTVGILDVPVGGMVALCQDGVTDLDQLPGSWAGPLGRMEAVLPIGGPPRTAELATLDPLHISDITLRRDGGNGKITLDASRRYLVRARFEALEKAGSSKRWDMSRWWLDVPPGIPGANLVGAGKRLWIVVERPTLEEQADGSKARLVLRAAAIVDHLFP